MFEGGSLFSKFVRFFFIFANSDAKGSSGDPEKERGKRRETPRTEMEGDVTV